MTLTYNGYERDGTTPTYGGYSTRITVDEDYVLRIPRGIPLERAAPLLCAGITTYSPLRHFGVQRGDRIAVIGLGGLGHMAVKLADAMGARVTVLSHSPRKREDALVEMIPIQQINEAYERMLKGEVRYRFVIDIASLKPV